MFEFLFSYEVLRVLWWALLGILLIAFAVTDGFDLGTGILLPFVAKTDAERRVVINTVGPVWEGNQVWFILGGGAIFAAWPALYALSFSGFYLAMFLVLAALILRPVAFKYRSKRPSTAWRRNWDYALFVGSSVPSLIFGVAVGNTLRGVPFHFTDDLRPIYEGNLFGLLNPVAIYAGLVSVAMIVAVGAAWLVFKADGVVAARARRYGSFAAIATAVLFAGGGLLVSLGLFGGYQVVGPLALDGPSNPLNKEVVFNGQAWLANFSRHPVLWIAPALGVAMPLLAWLGFRARKEGLTVILSQFAIVGIIATVGLAMFPVMLPSSTNPAHSLTVFDASSSRATLRNMLIVTAIFLPIIIAYTAWVYRVLWGKVTSDQIDNAGTAAY
jgi:cytochrome d ubiquinol oxidase subunit II